MFKGVFQSGQMGQTVNLLALPSVVRIHPRPLFTNPNAEVAQLIEHQPSKLRVASLSLVFRSNPSLLSRFRLFELMVVINFANVAQW